MLLSLEQPHPIVDEVLTSIDGWERGLAGAVPADHRPRMSGTTCPNGSTSNARSTSVRPIPMFPEYRFRRIDHHRLGFVTFPIVFEGPPGLVHGGFSKVLFDCVTPTPQLRGRQVGQTRSADRPLSPPTRLETELRFEIVRATPTGRSPRRQRFSSMVVLYTGEVSALALPPERLSPQRFALRRES